MAHMTREEIIKTIDNTSIWDVLVIGGGASGLGTALESASRGYRTLLLEAHDYAKGTSSRSTKLVHGGVRYLAQGNISLVKEALHERGVLKRNAPHLVHDMGFLIAAYSWWSMLYYGLGLKIYDWLAGQLNLKPSRWISHTQALTLIPTLKKEKLKGGILYFDGQFDDSRLAITLMRSIQDCEGVTLNYAPVVRLIKEAGQIRGAVFRDAETDIEHQVRARSVVNATGVFVDQIRHMEDGHAQPMLSPSQGVHIVVPRKFLPSDSAIMIPHTKDGRVLFALPWHDAVVIGTTDTPVSKIEFEPRASPEEIEFILNTIAQYMNPAPTRADVLSVYAGLRPLVKDEGTQDTKSLSRSHIIRVSKGSLITLTGGKWTIYRRMGQDTIDEVVKRADLPIRHSVTESLKLHGWHDDAAKDQSSHQYLKVYGTDAVYIKTLGGIDIVLDETLPHTEAEVRWAVRYEQARTLEDVLARRIRILFLNTNTTRQIAPRVAQIMAEELDWDDAQRARQLQEFNALIDGYSL